LQADALEALTLTDVSVVTNQARVTLCEVPDRPGFAADLFEAIGKAGIFVDMIVQGVDGLDGSASISLTVASKDLPATKKVADAICAAHQTRGVTSDDSIAKIAVSGIGLRSHTLAGKILFEQLASAGLNVEMISTSELQLTAVVDSKGAVGAAEKLKLAFGKSLIP
jgi:aspartate kinase